MKSALVLAAGKATRLGEMREQWAKACVPVGDTTPLGFLLPRLHAAGINRVWINLHFRPHQVRREAERCAPPGLELKFIEEETLLGTGGTLIAVDERDCLPDLVVNAKVFTDLDFATALNAPAPCVVLHPHSDLSLFGGFSYAHGELCELLARGTSAIEKSGVFTGICRPSPLWVEHLRRATKQSPPCLVRDGMLPAIRDGEKVRALIHHGQWCEVSTPERIEVARRSIASWS